MIPLENPDWGMIAYGAMGIGGCAYAVINVVLQSFTKRNTIWLHDTEAIRSLYAHGDTDRTAYYQEGDRGEILLSVDEIPFTYDLPVVQEVEVVCGSDEQSIDSNDTDEVSLFKVKEKEEYEKEFSQWNIQSMDEYDNDKPSYYDEVDDDDIPIR